MKLPLLVISSRVFPGLGNLHRLFALKGGIMVAGPYKIRAEDTPLELAERLPGSVLYWVWPRPSVPMQIAVDGEALHTATLLAQRLDGVVWDRDEARLIWPDGTSHRATDPVRYVQCFEVRVRLKQHSQINNLAGIFASELQAVAPEAVPFRFGESWPLQGQSDGGDGAAFVDAWCRAGTPLFFSSQDQRWWGRIDGGQASYFAGAAGFELFCDPQHAPVAEVVANALFKNLGKHMDTGDVGMTEDATWLQYGRMLARGGGRSYVRHRGIPLSNPERVQLGIAHDAPTWSSPTAMLVQKHDAHVRHLPGSHHMYNLLWPGGLTALVSSGDHYRISEPHHMDLVTAESEALRRPGEWVWCP